MDIEGGGYENSGETERTAMGRSKGGIEASYDATPFDEAPEAGAGSGADVALGSEEPASV